MSHVSKIFLLYSSTVKWHIFSFHVNTYSICYQLYIFSNQTSNWGHRYCEVILQLYELLNDLHRISLESDRTMQTTVGVFGGEKYTDGVNSPPLMVENARHSGRPAVSSLNCPPFIAVEACREHLVFALLC